MRFVPGSAWRYIWLYRQLAARRPALHKLQNQTTQKAAVAAGLAASNMRIKTEDDQTKMDTSDGVTQSDRQGAPYTGCQGDRGAPGWGFPWYAYMSQWRGSDTSKRPPWFGPWGEKSSDAEGEGVKDSDGFQGPPWMNGDGCQGPPWMSGDGCQGPPWMSGDGCQGPPWISGDGCQGPPWMSGDGHQGPPWMRSDGCQGPPWWKHKADGDRDVNQMPPWWGGCEKEFNNTATNGTGKGDEGQMPPWVKGGGQMPPWMRGDGSKRPPWWGQKSHSKSAEGETDAETGMKGDGSQMPPWMKGDGGQIPPWIKSDGGQMPPWMKGDGSQMPPWMKGDGGQMPPWMKGDGGQMPPWMKGDGGQMPSWMKGDGGQMPPWMKGDEGQMPPWMKGDGNQGPPWWMRFFGWRHFGDSKKAEISDKGSDEQSEQGCTGSHPGQAPYMRGGPPPWMFSGGGPPWAAPQEKSKDPPLEGEPFDVDGFIAMKRWAEGNQDSFRGPYPWFGPPGPWMHHAGAHGPPYGPSGAYYGGKGPRNQECKDPNGCTEAITDNQK